MKKDLREIAIQGMILLSLILLMIQIRSYINERMIEAKATGGKTTEKSFSSSFFAVEKMLLNVPLISQMPELPRGCEVTSLAMLIKYAGIPVDKTTLSKEIKKDQTPYEKREGNVYFGNPYNGFVGDMYTFKNPGYGVYHGPIAELLEKYMPGKVIDLTGKDFEEIIKYLQKGVPVWVINNSHFSQLSEEYFETWYTSEGPLKITMKEHAVVITGYDQENIYFNDPLKNEKDRGIPRKDFEEGWIQMGKQAITYLP